MGFLNENESLAYFAVLGELQPRSQHYLSRGLKQRLRDYPGYEAGRTVVRSVFHCGRFQDFKFSLTISRLFQEATPLRFSWLKDVRGWKF